MALTAFAAVTRTVQAFPFTVSHPVQPTKSEPRFGVAVNVTVVLTT